MARCAALLFLACASAFGQTYTISTLSQAGRQPVSHSNPESVAVDTSGDVYFG